jgi:hypothetical protein
MLRVAMGYSWDIRGVFMGYTYVSGMCRVCIGYVSGKYRNIKGANGGLQMARKQGGHGGPPPCTRQPIGDV